MPTTQGVGFPGIWTLVAVPLVEKVLEGVE